ncbi:hypothetical protein NZK35_06840 [Stieleria sp. ICT_E10.1]|uniref:hypothetical protein n=1 Tax=Stieleria sedimenti TaxID=2976331 RepID=UPI00218092FE|nr:hypothetical protein [Stieleria sedimenti]MCS7466389.1 hypothetical protein [Stieleria sedimenti]
MSTKPFGIAALTLAAMFTFASLAAQPASAQGSKIRSTVERRQSPGKGFWANQRTSRNIQHARDYSRSIGSYTTQAPVINPAITHAESQMLGMQLQGIQRDMGIVREVYVDNPQVVEQVKVIDNKLAAASETQKMLHMECCKETPDGKICGDMATKLTTALDEIRKDHAKLMKMTGDDKHEGHAAPDASE